ncbi:SCD domain-containing protein [Favolaschia claudopus]|uniref:SCD domain-containing protein n=1 Tax=Favolaschia claudopus TaxID=2862362 RepID=A0AAW0B2A3_9AGAR
MSTTPAPRRSLRERKPVAPQSPDDDDDPKPRRKAKQSPIAKKPRKTRKTKDGEDAFDPQQVAKESKIHADNPLFSAQLVCFCAMYIDFQMLDAILNPAAALQSTSEDFLESLDQSPGLALAEIVNLVLRSCGCNESVDADQVVDYDGVVDALDKFTEDLKNQEQTAAYPLTSKLPAFKKFRKSLHEFLDRLITSAASLGSLYTSDLIPTLQAWVIAMSSSQIRSFRHTATFIALELESALCGVAAAVEKEAELSARQREGEKKRRAGKAAAAGNKNLDAKAAEIREHRDKLKEFIKEFIDGVFMHRYRDLDPVIRADCVLALGTWFTKHPAHFLEAAYLRYLGWVLSDPAAPVRLAAVKALDSVYSQSTYAARTLQFTERFKTRLLEMATKDVDAAVRVSTLGVLELLAATALEEDERETVALCVFDAEKGVRRAIGPFVHECWRETVEERLVGRPGMVKDEERARAGVKAFGTVLVQWGARLDEAMEDEEEDETESGEARSSKQKEPSALVGISPEDRLGRAGLVVEALWDHVEAVSDWETLLDVLLLDHSSAEDTSAPARKGKANGKARANDEGLVDEAWRLEEEEETVLIEVLVASLHHAKAVAKKGEEETVTNDITRALIKALPRLLMKHQTDQNRIANVLALPSLMNLDLYLEMRMMTNYTNLWDDIIKQFLSHSQPSVLRSAIGAFQHLLAATSLSNQNNLKMLELEDELSSALRDAVAGREEIEVAGFDEDEVIALGATCARLAELCSTRDMSGWMEEDEGGKQSNAWNIVSALADRGRLGYKEEAFMISQSLQLLTVHVFWKATRLRIVDPEDENEEAPEQAEILDKVKEQRDSLLEKLVEFAVGTQSNTAEAVTRTAFMCLMNLHMVFGPAHQIAAVTLDDEVQFRCAGYVQAEIERYAETLVGPDGAEQDANDGGDDEKENDSGDEEGSDAGAEGKKRKDKGKGKAAAPTKQSVKEVDPNSHTSLLTEYAFIELIVTFVRAIQTGALHVRHTGILLSHYGRLGTTFDHFTKPIVDMLREEGMTKDNGDLVVVVVNQALQEAFTMVLDGVVSDETNAVQLAKHLLPTFILRGAHLAVLKKLDPQYIVQIQTNALSWIAKRIAIYETNSNKKSLRVAITFFRVLVPLLASIQSRDAMKIKAHMDQVLAQAKVEVSATSKVWEPQRAYEKRLAAIMAKDKVAGTKGRKPKASKGDGLTTDEDETDLSEVEKLVEDRASPPPAPRPRPRARPRRPAKTPENVQDDDEDDDQAGPSSPEPPTTPKARPRVRATYKSKAASKSPVKASSRPSPEPEPDAVPSVPSTPRSQSELSDVPDNVPDDAFATPVNQNSRKRSRSMDDDDADDAHSLPAPSPTPAGDMQIRRKRARH